MSGEQVIEAIMTNVFVRAIEVLIAPILIWWKSSGFKKEWPKPVLIGFLVIVTASCLFLEEKLTALVRYATYDDQRVIRDWLDELKLGSTLTTSKEEVFRITVTGESTLAIFKKRDKPRVITFQAGVLLNQQTMARLQRLSVDDRKRLQNEMQLELARHNYYFPAFQLTDNSIFNFFGMENDVEFPEGSSKSVLDEQFRKVTNIKRVVDLVVQSWIAQGKL